MLVETKLTLSKAFPPGTSEILFGRYKIRPIPSELAAHGEALLAFSSTYEHPIGGGSHPEEEAEIVCKILSLFLDTRIKKTGTRINCIDIPVLKGRERSQYPQFFGVIDPTKANDYLARFLSLDDDVARQYIRASRTYSFALEFIPADPTFAFFLLVVAGECMSSQDKVIPHADLQPDRNKCERFCQFIISFLLDEFKDDDERDEKLFMELLKTAYYDHRSSFTHGGKEVSMAALKADEARSSYFKHATEGREVKTPGLGWFAKVIRGALLGYLLSIPTNERKDEHLLSRLAFEKAGLKVKVKRDLQLGEVVTFDDIEYR